MPKDFVSIVDDTSDDYKLVYEEHRSYFFACVEAGVLSDNLRHEYKKKMAVQIGKRKYNCVMIKRDVPIASSAVDLLAVIYKVRDWKLRSIKYAFVDVNPEHLNAYKLAALYARSRQILVKVFGDVPRAEKWLLAGDCRQPEAPK